MITTIMAAFAFGYCVADLIIGMYNKKRDNDLLKTLIESEK